MHLVFLIDLDRLNVASRHGEYFEFFHFVFHFRNCPDLVQLGTDLSGDEVKEGFEIWSSERFHACQNIVFVALEDRLRLLRVFISIEKLNLALCEEEDEDLVIVFDEHT